MNISKETQKNFDINKYIGKWYEIAKSKNIVTVGFTGATGGSMKDLSDFLINVPSTDTPRIQESHIMVGHIICQLVEEKYFAPIP